MDLSSGASIVAVLATVYGLSVAFGHKLYDNRTFWSRFTVWGAVALAVLAILLIVLPWLKVY